MLVLGISAAVFWRTAYPTITWWDSSSYSLAAGTLGIASAPGSLLLTFLGWLVVRLPFGSSPAYRLNLFAGVLAAVATALVYVVSLRLAGAAGRTANDTGFRRASIVGAALGALSVAFSATLWDYAIKFTPYVLSAVFTGLILWTMVRWWEEAELEDSWRWLALLAFLFGLDFSVHRTNALLLPGALVWILLRHPRTLTRRRVLLGGAGGLFAGLSFQLLTIPVAANTKSQHNFFDPSNWSRFWDYVSLKSLGGGFLLNLLPRKAAVWSVQVADVRHFLGANFFHWTGPTSVLGVLPGLAAILGLVVLWRSNRRLGIAYALVLSLQAATTVLYFNIPADYFRSFDRHYLPMGVTIGVLVAFGLSTATVWVADAMRARRRTLAAFAAAAVMLVPATQVWSNWAANDASRRYFARDYAANVLSGLPLNTILITVGDNDTFPLMYLQDVEGVRRDVRIINLSVASMAGHADYLRRLEPAFPLSLTASERAAMGARKWPDTSLVVPVMGTAEQLGLAPGTPVPRSITMKVWPDYGPNMLIADITLLDIVRTNQWKRPLAFAITAAGAMDWLEPYRRLDGLFWRIMPVRNPPLDLKVLRANLLDHSQYRGYADPSVRIDHEDRTMGYQYYSAFKELLDAEQARGGLDQCRADAIKILALLPLKRMGFPPYGQEGAESDCVKRLSP